ncbi:MAG TPA: Gfo/Idh/MocA family oxidoreductase [Chloroflexota bacterium]|nr:Gfo/Idh/MocA family oxidoreductase [Chloroflexota bacterium]
MTRRALIVGAGGWSRAWGRAIADSGEVTLAGWVDIAPGAAAAAVTDLALEGVTTGTDFGEVVDVARPDFVVNATTPSSHCDVTVKALESGLPVICEKPMAESMDQAHRMVEASERTGKLLMISQQRSHDPKLVAMRGLIVGHIGPLGMLDCDFYHGHPEPGYHRGLRSALLFDMAIHEFDAARVLSGADPVRVYCEDFNPPWSWHSSHGSALAIFEMTGGLRFSYRGSWVSQGWDTTWESQWRAIGPHGTVLWDGDGDPVAETVMEPGAFPPRLRRVQGEVDAAALTGVPASLHAFLGALDTGIAPLGECHDNIKTFAMAMGAIESAETGKRVDIKW